MKCEEKLQDVRAMLLFDVQKRNTQARTHRFWQHASSQPVHILPLQKNGYTPSPSTMIILYSSLCWYWQSEANARTDGRCPLLWPVAVSARYKLGWNNAGAVAHRVCPPSVGEHCIKALLCWWCTQSHEWTCTAHYTHLLGQQWNSVEHDQRFMLWTQKHLTQQHAQALAQALLSG